MSPVHFTLLVLAVCFLLAAANIINDYFDTKTDRISGVRNIVVGRLISRRNAITLHAIFNVIAIVIVLYLSLSVGMWKIAVLFFIVSGILWFYSSSYKRYFITGNLLVGILAALIPFCVPVFEIPLLNKAYADLLTASGTNFIYLMVWIAGFSFFILLNTLMYEINKDIFSIEGDREHYVHTIPVKAGIPVARSIIIILSLVAITAVILLYINIFHGDIYLLLYLVAAVITPYLIYIWSLVKHPQNRALQLGLIRSITVACMMASLFLKHFLSIVFME